VSPSTVLFFAKENRMQFENDKIIADLMGQLILPNPDGMASAFTAPMASPCGSSARAISARERVAN
jgi:hypothetical protein